MNQKSRSKSSNSKPRSRSTSKPKSRSTSKPKSRSTSKPKSRQLKNMRTLKRHNMDGGGLKAAGCFGTIGAGLGAGLGYATYSLLGLASTPSMIIGGVAAISAGTLGAGLAMELDDDITQDEGRPTSLNENTRQQNKKISGDVEKIEVIINRESSSTNEIKTFTVSSLTSFRELKSFITKKIGNNYSNWNLCSSQEKLDDYKLALDQYYETPNRQELNKPQVPFVSLKNLFDSKSQTGKNRLGYNIRRGFDDFFGKDLEIEQSKNIELYIFDEFIDNSSY